MTVRQLSDQLLAYMALSEGNGEHEIKIEGNDNYDPIDLHDGHHCETQLLYYTNDGIPVQGLVITDSQIALNVMTKEGYYH